MTIDARLVMITAGNAAEADRLATGLIDERLAACVNILPAITSVYRWEGKMEKSVEILLMAKTTAAQVDTLTSWVIAHHSYDLPEIIALPIDGGSPAYLKWIGENTAD